MVYGDQVILLPFTISYSVNKDFNIDDCGGSPMSAPQPTFVQAADNEPSRKGDRPGVWGNHIDYWKRLAGVAMALTSLNQ
jgi:hypothetical protein